MCLISYVHLDPGPPGGLQSVLTWEWHFTDNASNVDSGNRVMVKAFNPIQTTRYVKTHTIKTLKVFLTHCIVYLPASVNNMVLMFIEQGMQKVNGGDSRDWMFLQEW